MLTTPLMSLALLVATPSPQHIDDPKVETTTESGQWQTKDSLLTCGVAALVTSAMLGAFAFIAHDQANDRRDTARALQSSRQTTATQFHATQREIEQLNDEGQRWDNTATVLIGLTGTTAISGLFVLVAGIAWPEAPKVHAIPALDGWVVSTELTW